jgi:type IV pilus assembly protein PilM
MKEIWGLDIGRYALKAVKMRRNKNQVEIIGVDMIEYDLTSDSDNSEKKEEQIQQALTEFQTRYKLKGEKIFVSIPGQSTLNRIIQLPPVEPNRIKEAIKFEAQHQIPFAIEEVEFSYQLLGEPIPGEEREVMLFAVRKEIINKCISVLSASQIPPEHIEGIQIPALALYNFIRFEKPELNNCLLVDIGSENTHLVVVDGDRLWIRGLPISGNDITQKLQKQFNTPFSEAEQLKIKAAQGKQPQKIFEVIRPVLKDLVGEINRSVGFYSNNREFKVQKIIFMGNSTKLVDFAKFFKQNLQYPIEVLSEVQNTHVALKQNLNLFQNNIAGFAVAIGLAIQGLKLAQSQIDLTPDWLRSKAVAKRQKIVLAISVALLAFVPFWLWFTKSQLLQDIEVTLKEIGDVLKPIKTNEIQLKATQNYDNLTEELTELSNMGKKRDIWLAIFNTLNTNYLKTNQNIKDKVWILGLTLDQKSFIIKMGDQKDSKEESFPYIESIFTIVFRDFGDPVKNRNFVVDNLIDPAVQVQYEGKPLFDKNRSAIVNIEIKDILFPEDQSKKENAYCHVQCSFITWLNMNFLFTIDKKFQTSLNENTISDELRVVLEEKKINEGEITMTTLSKDLAWQIQCMSNKYFILKYKEILYIYQLEK